MLTPKVRAKLVAGAEATVDLSAWQGAPLDFEFGIFKDDDTPETDFDNLTSLQLLICSDRVEGTAVLTATLTKAQMDSVGITSLANWEAGTEQHGKISISGAGMNFPIDGAEHACWWVLKATLVGGAIIVVGAGWITIKEDATSGTPVLGVTLTISANGQFYEVAEDSTGQIERVTSDGTTGGGATLLTVSADLQFYEVQGDPDGKISRVASDGTTGGGASLLTESPDGQFYYVSTDPDGKIPRRAV